MATTTSLLTLEDYDRVYGHQSGWEFRSGEAIRKPVPTVLHSLLAGLLNELLRLAGYVALVEVDVRLTADWSPRPDACGVLGKVEGKYPTAVDVICEVLSEGDDIVSKCRDYSATGAVGQIFIFDPQSQSIQTWNGTGLMTVQDLHLGNGVIITGRRIWRELEARKNAAPPASMLLD